MFSNKINEIKKDVQLINEHNNLIKTIKSNELSTSLVTYSVFFIIAILGLYLTGDISKTDFWVRNVLGSIVSTMLLLTFDKVVNIGFYTLYYRKEIKKAKKLGLSCFDFSTYPNKKKINKIMEIHENLSKEGRRLITTPLKDLDIKNDIAVNMELYLRYFKYNIEIDSINNLKLFIEKIKTQKTQKTEKAVGLVISNFCRHYILKLNKQNFFKEKGLIIKIYKEEITEIQEKKNLTKLISDKIKEFNIEDDLEKEMDILSEVEINNKIKVIHKNNMLIKAL
jgi:hypothetical protein